MNETSTLEILKQAILLERRGKAFYEKVADNADNPSVKAMFESMAEEEKRHMEILAGQYKSFKENGSFATGAFDKSDSSDIQTDILTKEIMDKISAADFEAAAIGAAISMEEKAVKVYADRAEAAADPEEKALYVWLSDWERQHLKLLMDIDKTLLEKVWHDNNFWPF